MGPSSSSRRPPSPDGLRPPPASSETVARRLARVRQRDTAYELELRSRLFGLGLRYRVHYPVPDRRRRTIDIAFPRQRLAVFVDGCFWHGCPEHATRPRSNAAWWRAKLDRNIERDRETTTILEGAGWRVLRIWEHVPPNQAAELVLEAMGRLRAPATPGRPAHRRGTV